jgi:glycosyltransferase involved in cell wall biosynthesis
MGHDVTVLTVTNDKTLDQRERRNGYTIIRQPSTATLIGNHISAGVAKFLWEADGFDVIHAHSHLYASTNLAAIERRLSETPLAITNHGLYSQNAPKWLFNLYLRTVGRWTFNQADMVFCYTDKDQARVQSFGVKSPIEVVINGIDTGRFTPDGPQSDRINHDGPVVLFVGRLVEGKRPQDALQAVSHLTESLNAKLYIVGEGPMRKQLEESKYDCVEFLGQVSYDEMPNVYRAGDILILPSRAEGLPRTVLEAFSSGIPVVSSHLEHTAPIVREGGETVEIGDIKGYSKALNRVLQNTELGSVGREVAVERFRWQQTVTETTRRLELLL